MLTNKMKQIPYNGSNNRKLYLFTESSIVITVKVSAI